ncbi:MAG: hypothetical protein HQL33_02810 [Alphaproteobacteria bacterium]|nr:hypothetical protein [Alphaproteobacteria bacterium]MBF0128904.1 hypothetical protein [Alphaproteobacteria bacterium]
MRHWITMTVGWAFLVLGLLGLVLPVLQGVLFLAIGGIILSRESPRTRLRILRLGRRHPRLAATFAAVARRAGEISERFLGRRHL